MAATAHRQLLCGKQAIAAPLIPKYPSTSWM
jgi:hypothetical protein